MSSKSKYYVSEVKFELRKTDSDGNQQLWTGIANAEVLNEAEYEHIEFYTKLIPIRQQTSITLENVQDLKIVAVTPQINFCLDVLPEPPFDYTWETHPFYDEFRSVCGNGPRRLNETKWYLKMVSQDSNKVSRATVIHSLSNDAIVAAAQELTNKHITQHRKQALLNGPVKLIGPTA